MLTDGEILRRLLKDPVTCIVDPEIAKALILKRSHFKDHVVREACMSILLNDGDWEAAKNDLRMNRDVPLDRFHKLVAWADKIKQNGHSSEKP